MLQALDFDAVEMVTADCRAGGSRIVDVDSLPYPEPMELPFRVVREETVRAGKDRFLHIAFVALPPNDVINSVYAALETWTRMLIGGYPVAGRRPSECGAWAEPAFVLDEVTIEQAFPEMFVCDERCFDAVLGYLKRLHLRGTLIDLVTIH